ncbi:MAG: type II toxin-antitoxin system VapC family toxin [Cyanobium sp.]
MRNWNAGADEPAARHPCAAVGPAGTSEASAWEIATKWRLGKLQHASAVVENYPMALHRLAAVDLPISAAVARQAGLWDLPHRDPFDRLLAAQARSDHLLLASTDPAFALFEGVMTLG